MTKVPVNSRTSGNAPKENPRNQEKPMKENPFNRGTPTSIKFSRKK